MKSPFTNLGQGCLLDSSRLLHHGFCWLILKSLIFNPEDQTHFDYLIRQTPLTSQIWPASLIGKIGKASQAELEHHLAGYHLDKTDFHEILAKNSFKYPSAPAQSHEIF